MKLSTPRNPAIKIDVIEKDRNARFIGILPIKHIDAPVYVFYNEIKHPRGSHYFGLTNRFGPCGVSHWVILDAGEAEGKAFNGILRADDTILHSYYHHDCATDEFGNMVDGGDSYFRCSVPCNRVMFTFKDGELISCQ